MRLIPLAIVAVAAPLCCAAIPLIAAGALSGVSSGFLDGPGLWLLVLPFAAAGLYVWRRKSARPEVSPAEPRARTGGRRPRSRPRPSEQESL